MMNHPQPWKIYEIVFVLLALIFILFLQGAIPFLMTPTLGQAVWTTGFARSFTHGSFFTIYAHDFGIPKPAAIAFGLAGAWPASILLRLGLSAADDYSMMMMGWFTIAFFAAYALARKFGNTRSIAILAAMTWMSMPIILQHAGYSMLSLGISLLPFYFLAAMHLFLIESQANKPSRLAISFYIVAVLISVFMDGYTFLMFATGTTILLIFMYKTQVELRPVFRRIILPVHAASFIGAYALYGFFIGRAHYTKASIDFFRGWGLDLSFIAIPTKGVHWLPDLLGFSMKRSENLYFGDGSVWLSTFSLPVMVAGILAWWLIKHKRPIATGIFFIALCGFYFSLGPSLKINSVKPSSWQGEPLGSLMPAKLAVMPTGNAWIFKALPGFNNTRSVYRWSALTTFACWLLIMICIAQTSRKHKIMGCAALAAIIVLNLPHLSDDYQRHVFYRTKFLQIDNELIPLLQQQIHDNEIVAFLPWGNDFFVNYLAPTAGFRSFNIGGDKDLNDAQQYWPAEMLASGGGPLNAERISAGLKMLEEGTADVLVIPYFDLLWSAHNWPCGQVWHMTSDHFACLVPAKQSAAPWIQVLKMTPNIVVTDSELFATVRLSLTPEDHKHSEPY